jgi:polysaccharide export outer membrane protein
MRIHLLLSQIAAAVLISGSTCFYAQTVVASAEHTGPHAIESNIPTGSVPESAVTGDSSKFALGPADVIHIAVWKNSELTHTVTIGPDGFISLPLLGDMHVAGMTESQLAEDLQTKLSSYLVNARVTVSLVEIRSRQVFVTGQVGKPGGYPLVAPMSVLQLIAQAGGLNTFAHRKDIVILRPAGDRVQKLKFNYNNAVRGDAKQNIALNPGDTVIVP